MVHSPRQHCAHVRAMKYRVRKVCEVCQPRRGLRLGDQALDPRREPALGAHVMTPRHGYMHHAIYVGRGHVVQYSGSAWGLSRGPVEEVPLWRFSRGRPIWVRVTESGWNDRPEVACRARSRLGEDRYRLLTNNCEHFCEWCVHGQHRSYQVEALLNPCRHAWRRTVESLPRIAGRAGVVGINGSETPDAVSP